MKGRSDVSLSAWMWAKQVALAEEVALELNELEAGDTA